MPVHQIVDMASVRHGFMTAVRPMNVIGLMGATFVVRCALILICFGCLYMMFVNVVPVNVVKMAVVKIIGMAVVLHGCVAASGAVDMGVSFMFAAGFSHNILLIDSELAFSARRRMNLGRALTPLNWVVCFVI